MRNERNISTSSNSSNSTKIKDHLFSLHNITNNGYGNSTLVNHLQQKTQELLYYQEHFVELQTKLKILTETNKLQAAEFAFKQNEYELEISNLKKNEKMLQNKLDNFIKEANTQKMEGDAILKNKLNSLSKKYEKWKNRSKQLYQHIIEKEKQIEQKNDEHNIMQKQLSKWREKSKKFSEKVEEYEKTKEKYKKEKLQTEKKYKKWKQKSKELTKQLQIAKENEIIEKENEELKKKLKTLDDVTKTLHETEQKLNKEKEKSSCIVSKYKNLHSVYDQLQEQYQDLIKSNDLFKNHIELELESLYDILEVEKDSINDDWTNLIDECSILKSHINELENSNNALSKRLNVVLEMYNNFQAEKEKEKVKANKEIYASQVKAMKEILLTNICNQSNELNQQVYELYHSIIGKNIMPTRFRSLILMIVFSRRLVDSKINKIPFDFNSSSLNIFQGRRHLSYEEQIRTISQKYISLTHELVEVKQECLNMQKEKEDLISRENEVSKYQFENEKMREAVVCYRKRMTELQEYLSTMVSPEQYEEMRKHTNNLEITNNKLKKENREKEIEIYHLKEESILMEKNIRDLEIKVNTQSQEASAARSEAFKKEEEIESLKTIIHEKNKNLISMERQFAGMADLNEQTNNKLLNLTIENNILNNRVEK